MYSTVIQLYLSIYISISMCTMRETRVRSLGWEDPLEKEMATHSSTLAWTIPWMEEPGRLQSTGSQRVRHDRATSLSLSFFSYIYIYIYFLFQIIFPYRSSITLSTVPCAIQQVLVGFPLGFDVTDVIFLLPHFFPPPHVPFVLRCQCFVV